MPNLRICRQPAADHRFPPLAGSARRSPPAAGKARRRQRQAVGQCPDLLKIQGLPIAPRAMATPSTPVSRSMSRQSRAVNRSPLPRRSCSGVAFYLGQKLAGIGPLVTLPDGPAVDRYGRGAKRNAPSKISKNSLATLRAVVHAAAHFDRQRQTGRQSLADPADDRQRRIGGSLSRKPPRQRPRTFFTGQPKFRSITSKPASTSFNAAGGNVSGTAPINCAPQGCSSSPTPKTASPYVPW